MEYYNNDKLDTTCNWYSDNDEIWAHLSVLEAINI